MQAGSNGPAFLFYEMQIPECVAKCFRQRVHVDVLIQEFDPELVLAAIRSNKPVCIVDHETLLNVARVFLGEVVIGQSVGAFVIDDDARLMLQHDDRCIFVGDIAREAHIVDAVPNLIAIEQVVDPAGGVAGAGKNKEGAMWMSAFVQRRAIVA